MNETVYEEFIIRELQLTNQRESVSTPRTVTHFHYMAWPDFGVPDHAVGIVHFVRLFRRRLPPSPANRPTVVHCRLASHLMFFFTFNFFDTSFTSTTVKTRGVEKGYNFSSAGVGRSGTFIALDRSIQAMANEKQVDVFGVVHEMRMERCHMVQNEV